MDQNSRWRTVGMITLIALGLGAADAWSHREPPSCPACEFEAIRTANRSFEAADPATKSLSMVPDPAHDPPIP